MVVANDRFLTGRQLPSVGGLPTLSAGMGIANEIRFDKRWQRRLERAAEGCCLRRGVEPMPTGQVVDDPPAVRPGKIVWSA